MTDWKNPQNLNHFTYALNNPPRYVDPTGHICVSADGDAIPGDCNGRQAAFVVNRPTGLVGVCCGSLSDPENAFLIEMTMPLLPESGHPVYFGGFGDERGEDEYHPGVDSLEYGSAGYIGDVNYEGRPVYSVAGGTVVEVDNDEEGDFGKYIVIEHSFRGVKLYSLYAHLSETIVAEQDVVEAGTHIGGMGDTGGDGHDFDTHLHFEVRKALNVDLDAEGIVLGSHETYWINSESDLRLNWIDLGASARFNYSGEYPNTWSRLGDER